MAYKVFETDPDGANLLAEDDLVSRQTLTIKEGSQFDLGGKVVIVEGSDEALARAEELITEHGGKVSDKGEEIKQAIDEESDAAAEGMGALFG